MRIISSQVAVQRKIVAARLEEIIAHIAKGKGEGETLLLPNGHFKGINIGLDIYWGFPLF